MRAALPPVILCLFVQYPPPSTWAAVFRIQPQQQETSQPSPSAPATPVQAGSTASTHAQESTTAPGSNDLQDALPPAVQLEISSGDKAFDNSAYEVALDHFKKASKLAGDSCVECLAGEAKALSLMRNEKEALKAADKMDAQSRTDADRAKVHRIRGFIYSADPKKLKQAETEYRQAVSLSPATAEYHLSLALTLMKEFQDDEGKREAAQYLSLAPAGAYALYAKQIEADPRRARDNFAPEFRLPTLDGNVVSLSDLSGRYVVLDFWATWCPACREGVGDLKDLTKKYPPSEVTLISVSADKDEAAWKSFVQGKKMTWTQYRDADGKVLRAYHVRAFPTFVVIGPDGIIRETLVGENPQDSVSHRLKESIETLAAKK